MHPDPADFGEHGPSGEGRLCGVVKTEALVEFVAEAFGGLRAKAAKKVIARAVTEYDADLLRLPGTTADRAESVDRIVGQVAACLR